MARHSIEQRYLFLSVLNKQLMEPLVDMTLRDMERGLDFRVVRKAKKIPMVPVSYPIQTLALYKTLEQFNDRNLTLVLKHYTFEIDDIETLGEELNDTLETLNLPKIWTN